MADIVYTPFYAGGWHDSPLTDTAILAAALQRIENGVLAATGQANGAAAQSAAAGTRIYGAGPVDRPSGVMKVLRRLAFYGNSEFGDNGNSSANGADRLLATIRPQSWFNGAVNGATAADMCAYAFGAVTSVRGGSAAAVSLGTFGASTYPNAVFNGGVVLCKIVRNDAKRDSVATGGESTATAQAKGRASFDAQVDAFVRLARAQYRVQSVTQLASTTVSGNPVVACAAVATLLRGMPVTGSGIPANSFVGTVVPGVSYRLSSSATSQVDVNASASASITATVAPAASGSWTATGALGSTGSLLTYTVANGATHTYTINLPAAARVAWVTLGLDDDTQGLTGSTYSVAVDGGTAHTGSTSRKAKKAGTTSLGGADIGSAQMAVDLGLLSSGAHTIVVTNTGTNAWVLADDCLLVESPTPPTVVLVKGYQLPAGGYVAIGGSPAVDVIYGGILDTVAARFPNDNSVLVWDPMEVASGFDNTTMIGATDGALTHLNDVGEQWAHDWLMSKLNALAGRAGLNLPS